MTKRELVSMVSDRLGYTQNEVAAIVQATLDTITDALAEGHRLEVRNFGVFEIKSRDPRIGRNPRTGEEVPILEKHIVAFKPGKALKELVQNPAEALARSEEARPSSVLASEHSQSQAPADSVE